MTLLGYPSADVEFGNAYGWIEASESFSPGSGIFSTVSGPSDCAAHHYFLSPARALKKPSHSFRPAAADGGNTVEFGETDFSRSR